MCTPLLLQFRMNRLENINCTLGQGSESELTNVGIAQPGSIWAADSPKAEAWRRRRGHVFMAKIAAEAQRYDDMVEEMKTVLGYTFAGELDREERKLVMDAYIGATRPRKMALRVLSSVTEKNVPMAKWGEDDHIDLIQEFRLKVEYEICSLCRSMMNLLDCHWTATDGGRELQAFYWRVKRDHDDLVTVYPDPRPVQVAAAKTSYSIPEQSEPSDPTALLELATEFPGLSLKDLGFLDKTSESENHKVEFEWGVETTSRRRSRFLPESSPRINLQYYPSDGTSDHDSVTYDIVTNEDHEYDDVYVKDEPLILLETPISISDVDFESSNTGENSNSNSKGGMTENLEDESFLFVHREPWLHWNLCRKGSIE
ncbi:hypothetical protein R1flu_025895 [Riccia fluitans]|uniref:14-3-3 domain-containing protein n=1 Tax=Riccia fluitans TaxID=41844 RepID=A0ABD1Y380_9MARC